MSEVGLSWARSGPGRAAASDAGLALAREVLGRRLDLHPQEVPIRRSPLGKPLVDLPGHHLSVAHADGWVLVADAAMEVGVDLEPVGRLGPAATRSWCRLEALAKCTGEGLPAETAAWIDLKIADVEAPPGFVAALAFAAPGSRVPPAAFAGLPRRLLVRAWPGGCRPVE